MDSTADFRWFVDELLFFRGTLYISGWAFHPTQAMAAVNYVLPGEEPRPLPMADYGTESPDVAAMFGAGAEQCRFAFRMGLDDPSRSAGVNLIFELADGQRIAAEQLSKLALSLDPYHLLTREFYRMLREAGDVNRVLEIGSRSRSGNVYRAALPPGCQYVGMDIKAGENVDVVGDAHALSEVVPPASFDAVYSTSTFEHLLMPWKAVVEMNKVLRPGGLVMVCTHQSFPLHEVPWDFFRFSDQAWHGLFNAGTGFEIVKTALGEPVSLVPRVYHPIVRDMDKSTAFIGSAVVARKTAETRLSWDVSAAELVRSVYPH